MSDSGDPKQDKQRELDAEREFHETNKLRDKIAEGTNLTLNGPAMDFIMNTITSQQLKLVDSCIKYIRSGEVAGSFSEGCTCERCDLYEKKVRKQLIKATQRQSLNKIRESLK